MRYRRSAARCQSCKKPGGERAKCELLAFTVSDGSLPKTLLQRYRSTPRRRLPTGDGPGSWPIVRKGPTLPSRLATNWPRCHTATPAKSNRLPRLHRIYACPRSLPLLATVQQQQPLPPQRNSAPRARHFDAREALMPRDAPTPLFFSSKSSGGRLAQIGNHRPTATRDGSIPGTCAVWRVLARVPAERAFRWV